MSIARKKKILLHEIEPIDYTGLHPKKIFLLTDHLKRILPKFGALNSKIALVFAHHVNFLCKMHFNIL